MHKQIKVAAISRTQHTHTHTHTHVTKSLIPLQFMNVGNHDWAF